MIHCKTLPTPRSSVNAYRSGCNSNPNKSFCSVIHGKFAFCSLIPGNTLVTTKLLAPNQVCITWEIYFGNIGHLLGKIPVPVVSPRGLAAVRPAGGGLWAGRECSSWDQYRLPHKSNNVIGSYEQMHRIRQASFITIYCNTVGAAGVNHSVIWQTKQNLSCRK